MIKIEIHEEQKEYFYRQELVTWEEAMEFGRKNNLKLLGIDELLSIPREEIKEIPGVFAGLHYSDGSFYNRGYVAYFWSSSDWSSSDAGSSAWIRLLNYSPATEYRNTYGKSFGFSAIYKKEE